MLAELVLLTLVLQADRDDPVIAGVQIIVHASNEVASLSREQLSDIFRKKTRSWRDRSEILPVDQPATSPLRERFSRSIHGKSVAYLTRYWHRLIFSGRGIPPPELSSSAAVIEFVMANRGAIGYVETGPSLPVEVKVITVTR